jgi:uncharacterized protein (TIGR03437 family)
MFPTQPRQWKRAAGVLLAASASVLLPALCQAQTPPVYTVTTIVGTGAGGYTGDGAAANAAEINGPSGVALDSKGNIYIADQFNNVIRMVTVSNGNIATVAGDHTGGYSGDAAAAVDAKISSPDSLAVDSKGNIYFSDVDNFVVRMVTASTGYISTVAGNNLLGAGDSGDGALATSAQLDKPAGVAVDPSGNLYIADSSNNEIRLVTQSTGDISIFAGTGYAGFAAPGGVAKAAKLNAPRQIALDAKQVLYIADTKNNQIRKVAGGIISLVAGSNTAQPGYFGDGGPATSALLDHPTGVAVDTAGNVYIADSFNNAIRMVTANGYIYTIAGNGKPVGGYTGDGGLALSAQFDEPTALAVDGSGNVYIADLVNNAIRLLTPNSGPAGPGPAPAIRTTGNPGVQSASDFGYFQTVAPGSWIEIYGANLAADTRPWNTNDFTGINAPTSLDRTTVTIGGQSAFVDYISPTQVNAQVPGTIGTGPLAVTVTTAAGTSNSYTVTAKLQQPGLWAPAEFSIVGTPYVAAQFTDLSTYVFPTGSFAGITSRPAKPGEIVVVYGIGFGPVPGNPPGQIPQAANGLTLPVQPKFYFGGVQAQVQFAGLVASDIGLYQFNLIVPNIPNNNAVPLTFTVNVNGTDMPGTQTLYTAVHQ